MRIQQKMTINNVNKNDFDLSDIVRQAYDIGTDKVVQHDSDNIDILLTALRTDVHAYIEKFNKDFNAYARYNSTLLKMNNVLNPEKGRRKEKLAITANMLNKQTKTEQQFLSTMFLGHQLLIQIRKILTNQEITTEFIVQVAPGEVYLLNEKSLPNLGLVFDLYGAGTLSNPFSLAYELDQNMIKTITNTMKNSNHLTQNEQSAYTVWSQIKREYLDTKDVPPEAPLWFDSKDAEIFKYLAKQDGPSVFSLKDYVEMRKSVGGGGGYRSPFYKKGDIGLTQIKFFDFKDKAKTQAVIFARFSLIRDKFRQLETALSYKHRETIQKHLKEFFLEDNESQLTEMDKILKQAAENFIDDIFKTMN